MKWPVFLIVALLPFASASRVSLAADEPLDLQPEYQVDRRPGILEPPSDYPTGVNAADYSDEKLFGTTPLETALDQADEAQDD